jgi:hypothetical protein
MFYLEFLEIIKYKYKDIDIEKYKSLIISEKDHFKKNNNDHALLQIWYCLSIIEAIEIFHNAFLFLKGREYYNGWNKLAEAEVIIRNIKFNFHNCSQYAAFIFLEQGVEKLQKIFPYKIFTSMVLIVTEERCSICGNFMDPFSGCEHIRGKVYYGELCYSIVSGCDFLALDFVEKPSMKCAVVFDDIDNPKKYKLLEYIIPKLPNEYAKWDYKILTKYEPHSNFTIGRNEKCPCLSGKKYKNCCLNNPQGVAYEHYEFLLPDELLKNTKIRGIVL